MQRVSLRQAEELFPLICAGPLPFLIPPTENAFLVVVGREEADVVVAAISSFLRGFLPSSRKHARAQRLRQAWKAALREGLRGSAAQELWEEAAVEDAPEVGQLSSSCLQNCSLHASDLLHPLRDVGRKREVGHPYAPAVVPPEGGSDDDHVLVAERGLGGAQPPILDDDVLEEEEERDHRSRLRKGLGDEVEDVHGVRRYAETSACMKRV